MLEGAGYVQAQASSHDGRFIGPSYQRDLDNQAMCIDRIEVLGLPSNKITYGKMCWGPIEL